MKKLLNLFLVLFSALFAMPLFADSGYHYFMIQVNNWGNCGGGAHGLTYFISDVTPGSRVSGQVEATISPGEMNTVEIAKANSDLSAHLKVIDPDIEGRIVWEGDIYYDTQNNKLYSVLYRQDATHYLMSSDITPSGKYSVNFQLSVGAK